MEIQQSARNCAEQFSVLSPREKCQSKNGTGQILSFFFQASIKTSESVNMATFRIRGASLSS
jgi:hypothetical protein